MKTTHQWLESLIKTGMAARELADKITFAGLEVEHLVPLEGGDTQLAIEVTSNRVDALGMLGLAREVHAITHCHTTFPVVKLCAEAKDPDVKVSIDAAALSACPHYTAQVITGVKVGESPEWLKQRLRGVGCAPVNNVVDITNYVMFEMSQPLHAFDLGRLAGREIRVRMGAKGEKFEAINHRVYELSEADLVIADGRHAVALAGIMGGKNSEISSVTTAVLLESAYFEPHGVKATGRRMDRQHSDSLASESRYRFERGVDPAGALAANARAAALIVEICGGHAIGQPVCAGTQPPKWLRELSLRRSEILRVMGQPVEMAACAKILAALGLKVLAQDKETLQVRVPSFRRDLEREIDLIEEVARVTGLGCFTPRLSLPVAPSRRPPADERREKVRLVMQGLGYDEAVTDTFVPRDGASAFTPWQAGGEPLEARAPINVHWPALRRSAMCSLVRVASNNARHGSKGVRLFERANVTLMEAGGKPAERPVLALCGPDYRSVNGAVQEVLRRMMVRGVSVKPHTLGLFAPGRGAGLWVGEPNSARLIAVCGEVSDAVMAEFDLPLRIAVGEIDLDLLALVAGAVASMSPLPRFPEVERDLAVVLPEEAEWSMLETTVRKHGGPMLRGVSFFDEFRGKQIPKGRKSVAFSMRFGNDDRTLVGEEVDSAVGSVVAALKDSLGAELRA